MGVVICFRDRTFCAARCETVECSRRWTGALQDAASVWWNPKQDPLVADTPPVAFSNFAPTCSEYHQPDPEIFDYRELEPGEVNP